MQICGCNMKCNTSFVTGNLKTKNENMHRESGYGYPCYVTVLVGSDDVIFIGDVKK